MEVHYQFTYSDWLRINEQIFRNWLNDLKPLSSFEYWLRWFLVVFFVLSGIGVLVFFGLSFWIGLDWYFQVGSAALVGVLFALSREVVVSNRNKRGLLYEFLFRNNMTTKLIEKNQTRNDQFLRQQKTKGQLDLDTQYGVRIEQSGYTLITDFNSTGPKAHQETRIDWSAVQRIDLNEDMVFFRLETSLVAIPRAAFADEEAFRRFAQTAQQYRTNFVRDSH
jgi:hypothetical protein